MSITPTPAVFEDHHYIPRCYLKNFTDKKHVLWVCEKGKEIRPSKPKKEANRPDYYTHQDEGERDKTAEDVFRHAESAVAVTLAKLRSPQYRLTDKQVSELYYFVALMFARVPVWRDYLDQLFVETHMKSHKEYAEDKQRFYDTTKKVEAELGLPPGDYEAMRQTILKGEYIVEQTSVRYKLGTMFRSAKSTFESLRHFDYEILYAPTHKAFVTSDNPVLTMLPSPDSSAFIGCGFGWKGVEVYFPLNKRACLRFERNIESGTRRLITERHIDNLNEIIMGNATHYLYSSEGTQAIAEKFEIHGCKSRAGKNAFMLSSEPPKE